MLDKISEGVSGLVHKTLSDYRGFWITEMLRFCIILSLELSSDYAKESPNRLMKQPYQIPPAYTHCVFDDIAYSSGQPAWNF